MNKENNQKLIVIGIIIVSIAYSALEVIASLNEQATSEGTNFIWSVSFSMVIALWANNDAKIKGLYKPYEYSYFVLLFWPVVLPYHLIKTRGTEGMLMFLGVIFVFFLPFVSGLVAWAYYT